MNILLFADFQSFGGTRTYFYYLFNYFKSTNFKIIYFIIESDYDDEIKNLLKLERVVILKNIKNENFIYKIYKNYFYPFTLFFKYNPNLILISSAGLWHYLVFMILPTRFLYILHSSVREKLTYKLQLLVKMVDTVAV